MPTVDPIQLQLTALDGVLTPLVTLNEALQQESSIDMVYGSVGLLQSQLNGLAASGIDVPLGVEPFKLRIDELAAIEPPVIYRVNECLMAAKALEIDLNATFNLPPCGITQRAWFVEQGEYVNSAGRSYNIAVAEFPRPVDAAWAIKAIVLSFTFDRLHRRLRTGRYYRIQLLLQPGRRHLYTGLVT